MNLPQRTLKIPQVYNYNPHMRSLSQPAGHLQHIMVHRIDSERVDPCGGVHHRGGGLQVLHARVVSPQHARHEVYELEVPCVVFCYFLE